jgi:hypothetical protein
MSLSIASLDFKSRVTFAIGNVCLYSGVVLSLFGRSLGAHHPAAYDGLRALLLCLGICLNVWAFRGSRRCRPDRV